MSGQRDLPTFLWDYETNRAIDEALPGIVTDTFGVVTHLGDGATLVALVVLFYWFGRRDGWETRGLLVGIAMLAIALTVGLKGVLDVRRPLFAAAAAGEPLAFAPDTYDGLSTPSGHATGAAAVYGGLAALTTVGRPRRRYIVAGLLVVGVAFSRVVIGVHYLGDVILGVVLGLAIVWGGRRLAGRRGQAPLALFVAALAVAVVAWLLGSDEQLAREIGRSSGGAVVWWRVRDRYPEPSRASTLLAGLLVLPVAAVFAGLDTALAGNTVVGFRTVEIPVRSGLRAAGYAVLTGGALGMPVVAERFDGHPVSRWLQGALPFGDGRTEQRDEQPDGTGE